MIAGGDEKRSQATSAACEPVPPLRSNAPESCGASGRIRAVAPPTSAPSHPSAKAKALGEDQ